MAANRMQLQGAVAEDPQSAPKDIEGLIRGFIKALVAEESEGGT